MFANWGRDIRSTVLINFIIQNRHYMVVYSFLGSPQHLHTPPEWSVSLHGVRRSISHLRQHQEFETTLADPRRLQNRPKHKRLYYLYTIMGFLRVVLPLPGCSYSVRHYAEGEEGDIVGCNVNRCWSGTFTFLLSILCLFSFSGEANWLHRVWYQVKKPNQMKPPSQSH